jgi:hypothetical protein
MSNTYCPRCDTGRLKSWDELNDDEREVVRRLEYSGGTSFAERRATHRWCTRCWYEGAENSEYA